MSLPAALSTRTARAADQALTTFPLGFVDPSGTGSGPYVPAHIVVDATGAPQVPALDDSVAAVGTAVGKVLAQLQGTLSAAGAVTTSPAGSAGPDYRSAIRRGPTPASAPTSHSSKPCRPRPAGSWSRS